MCIILSRPCIKASAAIGGKHAKKNVLSAGILRLRQHGVGWSDLDQV